MRKLVALAAAAVLVLAVLQVRGNRAAIARARAEAALLASQRDSLLAAVRDREQQQTALAV